MYETLLRPHEVQQLPPPRPLSQVIDKLKHMERYREEKRQRQIANAGKRKREEDEPTTTGMERETQTGTEREMGTGVEGGTEKRARVGTAAESAAPALIPTEKSDERVGSGREIVPPAPPEDATTSAVAGSSQLELPVKLNCSKVSPDVRGHTSYLTFARLVPDPSIQGEDCLVPAHAS
jgi:tRNA (adenine57-N1/adenine58-N1)-methyltransferase